MLSFFFSEIQSSPSVSTEKNIIQQIEQWMQIYGFLFIPVQNVKNAGWNGNCYNR